MQATVFWIRINGGDTFPIIMESHGIRQFWAYRKTHIALGNTEDEAIKGLVTNITGGAKHEIVFRGVDVTEVRT